MAYGKGIATRRQQSPQDILLHKDVIVHEKEQARLAVLKGVLIADAVAVGGIMQTLHVGGVQIEPVFRLEDAAAFRPQLFGQPGGDEVGADLVMLRAVRLELQMDDAHMRPAGPQQGKQGKGGLVRLGKNVDGHVHTDGTVG